MLSEWIKNNLDAPENFQRLSIATNHIFQDQQLYIYRTDKQLMLSGKVEGHYEEDFCNILHGFELEIHENKLPIPKYNSWATIEHGHKYVCKKINSTYIPFHKNSLAKIQKQEYEKHFEPHFLAHWKYQTLDGFTFSNQTIPSSQIAFHATIETQKNMFSKPEFICEEVYSIKNLSDWLSSKVECDKKRIKTMLENAIWYVCRGKPDYNEIRKKSVTFKRIMDSTKIKVTIRSVRENDFKNNIDLKGGFILYPNKFKIEKPGYVSKPAPFSEQGMFEITLSQNNLEEVIHFLHKNFEVNIKKEPLPIKLSNHPDTEKSNPIWTYHKHNNKIIHGMTGCDSPDEALKRLQNIIDYGGILSQQQRRKQDLKLKTLSPVGDIASGIDWAVPATIRPIPTYGKWIFFILEPEILHRNHIFFAPKDFGGGKNRFSAYQNYAKSIEQQCFTSPPSFKSRRIHWQNINKIISQFNEVWFKDIITWDEIKTVAVDKTILFEVQTIINKAQQNKLISGHIQVVEYDQIFYNIYNLKTCHEKNIS